MDLGKERLNGEDGLGGILPAMANAAMAFHVLGYDWNDPDYRLTREAIDRLVYHRDADTVTCQPCLLPIRGTCQAAHASLEAGERGNSDRRWGKQKRGEERGGTGGH